MRIKLLQYIYLLLLLGLFLFIILTPWLIKDGFPLFSEEASEMSMLLVLGLLSLLIYHLFQKEVEKNRNQFNSAVEYIGRINVQLEHLKEISDDITKYPKNKNDWKQVLKFLAQKVLGIVNADWTLFRVIGQNGETLSEHGEPRAGKTVPPYKISNKNLINDERIEGLTVVASTQTNFNLQVYCVIPQNLISDHQRVMIRSILNNAGMMYIIFTLQYYNNSSTKKNKLQTNAA